MEGLRIMKGVNMAVTGIGTYSSYTNSYGNTQNAGNKTGRTYKNAHEYKNYLTQNTIVYEAGIIL